MVSWDDIVNAIQGFYNWLVGVGMGFTNTLGELGSWIFGGFQWLGDRFKEGLDILGKWFKDAINYIADQLYNAYNVLVSWISPAIQWIGSGIAWVGQNLYAFGQWLYNGIVWVANAVWDFISSGINWIMQQLSNIWNSISEGINWVVSSFNLTWNNWIKGLRAKFKQLLLVNLTVPTTIDAFQNFVKQPSIKKFLGLIIAPVVGAITAELIDPIIPTPSSEQVNVFPPFSLPSWTWTQFSPTKPEYLTAPSVSTLTQPVTPTVTPVAPVGYGLPYDVTLERLEISYTTSISSTDAYITPDSPTYDTTTDSSDGVLESSIEYETEVR